MTVSNLILDVDGVLTDGTFLYSKFGKKMKRFGSHDAQAIKLASKILNIEAITADRRGFPISFKRCKDLNIKLNLVPEKSRATWIKNNFVAAETAFFGDSFTDIPAIKYVKYSFAANNSFYAYKEKCTHKLISNSAEGAVAEAVDVLFFEITSKHIWDYD